MCPPSPSLTTTLSCLANRIPQIREVAVAVAGCLAPMLQELLTDNAVLCELSCVISDPGAPRQPLHTDTDQVGSS